MSTTARQIITSAVRKLGAIAIGQTLDADNAAASLQSLNWMMGQLGLQPHAMATRVRETFHVVANQGTPANPYTIGSTGTFATSRPAQLEGAGLILTPSATNPVEIPLTLFTDDAYESIQVKTLSNNQPTGVWYQPTAPLGKIYLWPVPDNADNDLALYFLKQMTTFAALDTAYDLPPGADEMLIYNVAVRLAEEIGRALPDNLLRQATASLKTFKRQNMRFNDVAQDIFTGNRQYGYNIQTGNY